jgi:hypothetical protein
VSTGCQESAHASDLAAFAEVRLVSDTAGGRLDSRIRGGRSQVTLLKPTGGEADTRPATASETVDIPYKSVISGLNPVVPTQVRRG